MCFKWGGLDFDLSSAYYTVLNAFIHKLITDSVYVMFEN